jgi:hypothetical protein
MASSTLSVFLLPNELLAWLRLLCRENGLAWVVFRSGADCGELSDIHRQVDLVGDEFRIFLFPESSSPSKSLPMNDVRARDWGWVDVRPGHIAPGEEGPILTLTDIAGEDFDTEEVHPARFVKWLKRRLKAELKFGVRGINLINQGESSYSDIGFSREAEEFVHAGGVWKQFVDGNAVFLPSSD